MAVPRQRFRKADRLRSPADFRRVYERRCSARSDVLSVHAFPNGLDQVRVGFSVSRKVGNAVMRNRLRRLYREAFRLIREELPPGLDLVLIPRSPAEPSLATVQEILLKLATELSQRLARGKKSP